MVYDDPEVPCIIGLERSLQLCSGLAVSFCGFCVSGTGVTDTSGPHCHADWWQKQFWPIWLLDVACLDIVRITGNLSFFFISWILYPFALKPQSLGDRHNFSALIFHRHDRLCFMFLQLTIFGPTLSSPYPHELVK